MVMFGRRVAGVEPGEREGHRVADEKLPDGARVFVRRRSLPAVTSMSSVATLLSAIGSGGDPR